MNGSIRLLFTHSLFIEESVGGRLCIGRVHEIFPGEVVIHSTVLNGAVRYLGTDTDVLVSVSFSFVRM